jgi:hypothetical protein
MLLFGSQESSETGWMVMDDARDQLIATSVPLLHEIRNMTANADTERWLNSEHGPGTQIYDQLAALIKRGVAEGWAANIEVDGPKYRRSRIHEPDASTGYFSITAVYMDSSGNTQNNPEGSLRGQYHSHPYGEFNMVVPLTPQAAIAGPTGWCHEGWTAPPPGSHHYPEVKSGALIALFFLPAGRISYDILPPTA